jgi:PIN domain nuclease of toxin-antitoxin system
VRYVLDTHVWFWAMEMLERVPRKVQAVLFDETRAPLGVSAISLWEMAKLVQKGRIRLSIPLAEWFERALDPDMIEVIPLSANLALASTTLPENFASDPADELIVAATRSLNATLITADRRILAYPHVRTLWE